MLNFKRADGMTPLRSFKDVDHMNEYMVTQHNRVVKASDRVYFVGDIAMSKKSLPILNRMMGKKVLIRGNHDTENASEYLKYFEDVRSVHQFEGLLIGHIPVHPSCLYRWKVNVHGHLHANRVLHENGSIDDRYYNVCMEQLEDYTPISLEALKKNVKFVLERETKV
jgi:calcineurin-like phosphoesterase family protein